MWLESNLELVMYVPIIFQMKKVKNDLAGPKEDHSCGSKVPSNWKNRI